MYIRLGAGRSGF